MRISNQVDPKVVVALDFADSQAANQLVGRLHPDSCKLKVGKELFTAAGPAFVSTLVDKGFAVFLDLKFHDIPNTVAKACEAASKLGVWMLNVHASGGSDMLKAARDGVSRSGHQPHLIAVTVLTSMSQANIEEIGIQCPIEQQVLRLATLTQQTGLDGVVCSAKEAVMLRQQLNPNFLLVTPGIRPANASLDDQTRVMTPRQAIDSGVNYLVVGRPITQAPDPMQVLVQINAEIA